MLVLECVACCVMCMCELGGGLVVQADTDTPGVLDINKPVHLYILGRPLCWLFFPSMVTTAFQLSGPF